MLYAILCYHDEDTVGSWTKEQDAAVMKKLAVVQDRLTSQGRLGPVARLLPTTAATPRRGSSWSGATSRSTRCADIASRRRSPTTKKSPTSTTPRSSSPSGSTV